MTFQDYLSIASLLAPIVLAVAAILYKYASVRYAPFIAKHPVLRELVDAAVQAAEQEFKGSAGAEKKQAALNFLTIALKQYGIKVDPALLSFMIESAVHEMNLFSRPSVSSVAPQESPVLVDGTPAAQG